MDAGAWLTLVSIVVGIASLVVGGVIRWQANQIAELKRGNDSQRTAYEAKLEIADTTLDAKNETIADLRRQVDRYQITAEIQERFFKQLPSPGQSGDR